ncbi:hypothetical protein AY601_3210 [Pedobacter cryoconitis]|uniref:Uncharacterized protein n=1 Tax=Pedobacter cryoconitis TaxID=188932 RepID=A0A127VFW9_9SPHI|nr:hypothetical protein [Pedobacter cryoconitis]AMQ00081.1 hypothetical protein AY601_3210 [Pedobacter cryoconitis]
MIPFDQYYGLDGTLLGEDENGINGKVKFVSKQEDIDKIKANTKAGRFTHSSLVQSDYSTTKTVLEEGLNVLKRTVTNGGFKEESSAVTSLGKIIRGESGSNKYENVGGEIIASGEMPIPPGEGNTSIHSHPLGIIKDQDGNDTYSSAQRPGPLDRVNVFSKFDNNLIMGHLSVPKLGIDDIGNTYIIQADHGAVFYDKAGNRILQIGTEVMRKIMKP